MKLFLLLANLTSALLLAPQPTLALNPLHPGPTFLETTARIVTFIATLVYIVLPFWLLFAIAFILWRRWRKKPVKRILWILSLITILIFLFLFGAEVFRNIVFP